MRDGSLRLVQAGAGKRGSCNCSNCRDSAFRVENSGDRTCAQPDGPLPRRCDAHRPGPVPRTRPERSRRLRAACRSLLAAAAIALPLIAADAVAASSANCPPPGQPRHRGFRRASRRSRRNSSLRKLFDQGHAFFRFDLTRGSHLPCRRRSSAGASPTAIFSARKVVAHSLPGCATAKACSIPAMPGISPSSGKGRRSASISARKGSRTMMLVYDPARDGCDLSALPRHGRLGLHGGRIRHDGPPVGQLHHRGANPHPVSASGWAPMSAISTLRNAPPGIPSETMLRAPQHACPCGGWRRWAERAIVGQ